MKRNKRHIILKGCSNLCRLLLAVVFLFSGFTKAVDPHGTEYKVAEYLTAFGMEGVFPDIFPLLFAMVLATVEFHVGLCLLFGIRRHFSAWTTLLLLAVLTPLTLGIALFSPVSDCGCFGDAVLLGNWQTFGKNVVLLSFAIFLFRWRKHVVRFISENTQWLISLYGLLFVILLEFHCLYHLPIVDFRPFKIGADIREGVKIPENAEQAQFEDRFILEKDGVRKEFTLDDYPDSTWTYINTETVMLSEGYVPPIADFYLKRVADGQDIADEILADSGYTFLLVIHDLEGADEGSVDLINELYDYSCKFGYAFWALTSSGDKAIRKWRYETGAEYPFCWADDTMLKTMIRSTPGLLLLHDGKVINKWGRNDLPDEYMLTGKLEDLPLAQEQGGEKERVAGILLLFLVIPLLGITLLDRVWVGLKWIGILRRKSKITNLLNKRQNEKENCCRKLEDEQESPGRSGFGQGTE